MTNSGKKNGNDIVVDVAQPKHSNIKYYASAFSNIIIIIIIIIIWHGSWCGLTWA